MWPCKFQVNDKVICYPGSGFQITSMNDICYFGVSLSGDRNVVKYRDDVDLHYTLYKIINYNVIWVNLNV